MDLTFSEWVRVLWPLLVAFIGGVVWGIRLEGRVSALRELFAQRDKYLDSRHAELQGWMVRFDAKLDRLLEHR